MKKAILASLALITMLTCEAPLARAVWVRRPPPPPVSRVVVGRRPGPRYVWTGGYWGWGARPGGRRGYVWVPGRWRRPPRRNAVWVAPRWRATRGGYRFVPGRWRA